MVAFAACEIAVQSDNFIHIRHSGIWMLGVFLVGIFLLQVFDQCLVILSCQ
jgi:hypothetical protein